MANCSCSCSSIRTGDLLVWDKAYGDGDGSIWLKIVRFATMSNYGHVSVARRDENGELFHIEAVMPKIRESKIPKGAKFFMIPLADKINNPDDVSFLTSKVGTTYGLLDAIRAYLGLSLSDDDRWQCAELTQEFYRLKGLDMGVKSPTPSRLVKAALSVSKAGLFRVET